MYSRHRVAGYSIDHVIKFLFFLLVPVVILDIMISCFVIFSMRSQSIQSLQIQHPFMLRKSTPYIFPSIAI